MTAIFGRVTSPDGKGYSLPEFVDKTSLMLASSRDLRSSNPAGGETETRFTDATHAC